MKYPDDVTVTEYGPDLTIVTVTWQTYSTHYRSYIPPTAGEINEAIQIGRLRLGTIRQQINEVTRRLSE